MPRNFIEWTPDDDPAEIFEIHVPGDWQILRDRYAGGIACDPLDRIIEIAQQHKVVCVLQERRYIDLDYRSEHSSFYSTTFQRFPSVCHRLHFFTDSVASDLSNLEDLRDADAYRGYSVMRPLEKTPVGRTMIVPPPELADASVCLADDDVHLFGCKFTVSAMPFTSQDAQYLRCAHASQWMVLYHAHLRFGVPRALPTDVHDASLGGLVVGRQLPSEGLSFVQILASLQSLGLSPSKIALPATRADSQGAGHVSLPSVLCRYVNSDLPPIILSTSHAWVVVGYRVEGPPGPGHDRTIFYRHDDAHGPYIRVDDPWQEPLVEHQPWAIAIPPLPQKAYLSAERAELLGGAWISGLAAQAGAGSLLRVAHDNSNLSIRSYLTSSNSYKEEIGTHGAPAEVARVYRLAQWPRYIWVIEAHDRQLRQSGQPCVLGEAIIDATAHQLSSLNDAHLLAVHTQGRAVSTAPDFLTKTVINAAQFVPYSSSAPAGS